MPRIALTKESQEYDRILRTIRGSMKSVTDLAKRIGEDRTTLGKKLKGESPLTVMELLTIAQELEIGDDLWKKNL